jgi:hypothetical protein
MGDIETAKEKVCHHESIGGGNTYLISWYRVLSPTKYRGKYFVPKRRRQMESCKVAKAGAAKARTVNDGDSST